MENEKKKGLCGICPDKCWIEATIENGKLVKVEPDKDSPFGRVCPRGALSKEIIYSKDRILHPMVRIGKKGEGKFRRATWEEALEKAAEGFLKIKKQYGARALASYVGTSGREDGTMRAIAGKDAFFRHLGSPNDMSCGATCFTAANVITPITTLGIPQGMIQADFENAEIVVVWGTNLKTNSGPGRLYEKVKAAQKRGAYLIVIDPRKKGMGMEADWWIPVVPGSDGALALAMLKIIVEENKYDKEFVEKYTEGFGEFSEYLKQITVEEMSDYCGVDCEIIRLLADKLCSTTKAVLSVYTGIEYQRSAVQNYRAIQILWAITGKYDVEGGMYINGDYFPTVKLKKVPEQNQPIGSKEFPLFYGIVGQGQFSEIPKAVLNDEPYPVRGLLIAASSPALTYPDKKLWHEVYEKLDFLVVNERFMSEEIMYADVVFPATTYYENQIPVSSPLFGWKLRNRIIQPLGEARNDVHILQALAEKMGFGEVYPKSDEDTELWMLDGNRELLEKLKCSEAVMPQKSPVKYKKYQTGDLREDGMPGFPTPSGKFEICSKLIEECGYTGLPVYKDIRGIKELGSKEEYPMILTTGARSAVRFASFGPAVREIIQLEPYPVADINLEDAIELGINEGQKIWIETVFGKQSFRANICEITKGCIHAPFGSGGVNMLGEWKETNINEVCSMQYHDELSGFLLYKSMPCRVVLAE